MKVSLCILGIITLCDACGQMKPRQRILEGVPAKDSQFPYQVSLGHYSVDGIYEHQCGGSIINERWILTAAHCVIENKLTTVLAGITELEDIDRAEKFRIINFIAHENFYWSNLNNFVAFYNDIALVLVDHNIIFNCRIKPIELYTRPIEEGTFLCVSGWGTTNYSSIISTSQSNHLQVANVKAITNVDCQNFLGSRISIQPSHLCALPKRGSGICYGDSGGPLVMYNKQVGIISTGVLCGHGYPDVYTRVSEYTDWIYFWLLQ